MRRQFLEHVEAKSPRRFSRGFFGTEGFKVTSTQSTATKYDIYVFGEIEESDQFIEAIEVMDSASEQDMVLVHLSTNGGSVDATDTFVASMLNCVAKVVVRATGGCHSAGTLIMLSAPAIEVSAGANFLIHNGSMGSWGKTSDSKAQHAFSTKQMDRLARETYEGFLTGEEIEEMIAGKDFWMDAEEFMLRIRMREAYEALQDANDVASDDVAESSSETLDSTEVVH